MVIRDIIGLEKSLVKLVETISEGIGVTGNYFFGFDAVEAKRIGEAEAEVEKKKIIARAEGQAEAVVVLDRASTRFALEQYNKQINLENILVRARDDLKDKTVSDESVERDWTSRFFDLAQNTSREDIQELLAKILSGEIQRPGSFSYKTLETIRFISQGELLKFLKFIAISTDIGVMKLRNGGKESLGKYDLSFADYLNLGSIGLFNQSSVISYSIDLPAMTPLNLKIGNESFLILHEETEATKKFNFGLYVFSGVGKELRNLLIDKAANTASRQFKEDFIAEARQKGFKVIQEK